MGAEKLDHHHVAGHRFHQSMPPPHPSRFHRWAGTLLGASMWFFLMYRAKQDGPVLLGWRHPWEGHEHEHGQSNDAHS